MRLPAVWCPALGRGPTLISELRRNAWGHLVALSSFRGFYKAGEQEPDLGHVQPQ